MNDLTPPSGSDARRASVNYWLTRKEVKKVENGERITARLGKREIEVELESVTAYAEIIVQTEKGLGG